MNLPPGKMVSTTLVDFHDLTTERHIGNILGGLMKDVRR